MVVSHLVTIGGGYAEGLLGPPICPTANAEVIAQRVRRRRERGRDITAFATDQLQSV